uniref:RSE1/DDB1/CPSF1 C-terminal domain-containing protein n=2 Tax=Paramoeba aestuarina TaxID=180227 RepID=A0A7S4KRK9_9EUKA|mmetsp:Transcript_24053/g.37468  ORF Transcript_24053/g.37468 Transcript_24053/m.37468 type:complete len:173 (+) Transcript_24053:1286-1804(+)
MLDDDTYLVSDNSLNLVTLRKNNEGTTSEDRGHLEEVGLFHLGEFINRIRHGSLVMALPEAGESPIPTCLYATVDGSIGVVASLQYKDFEFFSKIEERMRKVVQGIGGLKHEQWRAFKNERRTAKPCSFIDGDLVETFLDLPRENMEQIVDDLPYSVEEVTRMIQTLARQLH